ncbi:MAG TPA: DUF5011 domain-containing protein, partial [Myxococcaceae bacterium]
LAGCTQNPPGPYNIGTAELVVTLTCTDSQSQSATCTGKVTMTDGVVPTITLVGPATQVLECRSVYTDPGATASDLCSGDMSSSIVKTGAVNPGMPGSYSVSYGVTDTSGNASSAVRNVLVQDTSAPYLSLNGPNPMPLECATGTFNDPSASAWDDCDGGLSNSVSIEFTNLNINLVGDFIVRYQVQDSSGNMSHITRNVQVTDTTPPVITVLSGDETVECGTQPSLGVVADDACFGSMTVVANPSTVPSEPGEYDVTYSARDHFGNWAEEVTRHITVVDSTPPELSIVSQNVYYQCTGYAVGNIWEAPAVTATDQCQGALRVQPFNTGDDDEDGMPGSIDPDDFGPGPDTRAEGQALVRYRAEDASGNAQEAALSVYVWDTLKPVTGLNPDHDGGDPAYEQIECFLSRPPPFPADPNPYWDPGAWAEDQCDGDLNPTVMSFGEVNKQVPDLYTLSYQVRDGAFNWADSVTRYVEVIDSQPPRVTLNGDNTLFLECSSAPYEDPGVTAIDQCDEQVHVEDTTATVNPNVPGWYRVDYRVSDSSGNMFQDGRSVIVQDTQPPTLRTLGGALSVACGDPLPLDVIATDACEGDLSSQVQFVAPDLTPPGTYSVRYQVSDSAGNTAMSGPRSITVLDPSQRMLVPTGSAELTLECNVDSYAEPGAHAWEGCGSPLPLRTYNSGQDAYGPGPDTSKEGTYYVEYLARNEKWHVLRALRAVSVVDRRPPVLTLQGPAHVTLPCGSAWVDPGVEALDTCYGDLRSSVVRTGEVNEQAGGVYTLRYEVKDGAGLSAPEVVRTVEITGCTPVSSAALTSR